MRKFQFSFYIRHYSLWNMDYFCFFYVSFCCIVCICYGHHYFSFHQYTTSLIKMYRNIEHSNEWIFAVLFHIIDHFMSTVCLITINWLLSLAIIKYIPKLYDLMNYYYCIYLFRLICNIQIIITSVLDNIVKFKICKVNDTGVIVFINDMCHKYMSFT